MRRSPRRITCCAAGDDPASTPIAARRARADRPARRTRTAARASSSQNTARPRGRCPIRSASRRARRAVARRPLQSLPVRHEPRLVRAVAARNARTQQVALDVASRRSSSTCTRWAANRTYYFAPPADPLNPLHHEERRPAWLDTFGRANAARFDERGFAYFIREVYDSFYPGYGESWPIFQGAIGMTYEQASARGLVLPPQRRLDADVSRRRRAPLHCGDHDRRRRRRRIASSCCATSSSTAATAVSDGEKDRVSRVRARARAPIRRGPTGWRDNLATQGIEVRAPTEPFKVGTRTHPRRARSSSPNAQPSGRLVRNLLEPRRAAARGVRQGAGPPPQEAAGRPDLRRDRVEPAARLRRRDVAAVDRAVPA